MKRRQSVSDYQNILYQTNNGVATITLNRPERLNAITNELITEAITALKTANKDSNVRAIVLTGAGRGFCAGQDIEAFSGERPDNYIYEHLINHYKPMIKLFRTIEKPIIGAINGVAAGAGASLALACDLRIMAKNASLLQAFTNIGLVPDNGATWFLVRLVGYSRAFELAVEGEHLSAERCLEWGLANRVVESENLMAEAQAWAEKLAQQATYAIALTKRALNRAVTSSLLEAVDYEAHLQQLAADSEDFAEGVKAFTEKRPPLFQGMAPAHRPKKADSREETN
jgi:2-(1,2-epoxy-1,2-dihydrophenyl)acetyl-CoA isomerase